MDSSVLNEAQDTLLQLKKNLPLALLTTITVSLIVAFWKKLLGFARRHLGLTRPAGQSPRATLPEGEIAISLTMDEFRSGFSVKPGWRGAVVDAGVVQREMGPGRYSRRAVSKIIAKHGLQGGARVVIWRDREFPVVLMLRDLFTRDHHAMQLTLRAIFRLKPERLLDAAPDEVTRPPEEIAESISEKIAQPARQWVGSLDAGEAYKNKGCLPEGFEPANGWIRNALMGSPFDLVRATEFRLANAVFDRLYAEYGEMALDNEKARQEVERNQVRGALRQSVLEGKLAELRDQHQHEDAVRIIEREKVLKDKTLKLELAQADLDELGKKIEIWKSRRDLLSRAMGAFPLNPPSGAEGHDNPADNFRRTILDSRGSPYSAQERKQIGDLLDACKAQAADSPQILKALVNISGIPDAVFDPMAVMRGDHTLRVGEGWRIFDGENLWHVRLTRIETRRHGFLWNRESPALASFETRGALHNRRLEQEVPLKGTFRLKVGRNEIPTEYLGGTPSRISIRIQ